VRPLLVVSLLASSLAARAEPRVLRIATQAPDGTAWARELKAFAREVETATNGSVAVKWYFGAVAGDEMEMLERVKRGQLDGAASGGPMCEALAPSMRVLRTVGLTGTVAEAEHLLARLQSRLEEEFRAHGFTLITTTPLGPHIVFSRKPIGSLAELRKVTFWVWDRDDVMRLMLPELGINAVPLPLPEAGRAYEDGRVDGFLAPPSVALAFQWSARARYVSDLRLDWISACLTIADRTFDSLSNEARQAFRGAGAKLAVRFRDVNTTTDAALMGGLFQKQGLQTVPVEGAFRSSFLQAAQRVREKLDARLADPTLLSRILGILADYRAEHRADR
jgi:TRAP-type C4-dicarboxylate transport system substrate-binding protein